VLFFTEDACSLYERDPRGHSLSILLIFLPKELYKKEFLIWDAVSEEAPHDNGIANCAYWITEQHLAAHRPNQEAQISWVPKESVYPMSDKPVLWPVKCLNIMCETVVGSHNSTLPHELPHHYHCQAHVTHRAESFHPGCISALYSMLHKGTPECYQIWPTYQE